MDFSIVERPQLRVMVFRGDIRDERCDAIAAEIRIALRSSEERILWDFTEAYSLAPRFFGFLASRFAGMILDGRKPVVIDPRMNLLGMLHVVGIDRLVEFVRSEDEAFEIFLEDVKFEYNKLFCQLLLQEGAVTPQDLQRALLEYNRLKKRLPFGKVLVDLGLLGPREIIGVVEKQSCYLGEILVERGTISRKKLNELLKEQARTGRKEKLGDLLVRIGMCSNQEIYEAISTQFKRRRRLRG